MFPPAFSTPHTPLTFRANGVYVTPDGTRLIASVVNRQVYLATAAFDAVQESEALSPENALVDHFPAMGVRILRLTTEAPIDPYALTDTGEVASEDGDLAPC